MWQAIHIFKKDARCLRFEIALVVLLAGVFMVLWPVAAAYLIARVIHAEAIPGDNQFWVTRPYRWTSLIAAKLLFIAVFLNLPVLLAQLYGLIRLGFPLDGVWGGLVWSQVLLALCFSLPAAALAAITPGMVSFLFLELVAAVIVFGLSQLSAFGLNLRRPWPAGVEWISNSLLVGLAAVFAIAVLLLQFRRRKTATSRVLSVCAVLAGLSVYFFLPPQMALREETNLTKSSVEPGSLQLSRAIFSVTALSVGQVAIPIQLSGVPAGVDVKVDGISGTLEGADGRAVSVFATGADSWADASGNLIIRAVLQVNPKFLKEERERPVTLRASLFFSLFGNGISEILPQRREPRTVMRRLRCSTFEFEKLVEFRCGSAFRWPGEMVYAQIHGKEKASFHEMVSYSPFPAELSLTPIEFHTALSSQGLAPPSPLGPPEDPTVTILAKRVLGHIRRDLQLRDIRLGELNQTRYRRPPPPPQKP